MKSVHLAFAACVAALPFQSVFAVQCPAPAPAPARGQQEAVEKDEDQVAIDRCIKIAELQKKAPCHGKWYAGADGKPGVPHPSQSLRVHACNDASAPGDIQKTLAIIDAELSDVISLMGEPLPDQGTGGVDPDPRIDIYLLKKGEVITGFRWGGFEELGDACTVKKVEFAQALAADPNTSVAPGGGQSGFLIIQRDLQGGVAGPLFKRTLVHEFFHVLQARYGGHTTCATKPWLVEATARAADIYHLPDIANKVAPGQPKEEFRWFQGRAGDQRSLISTNSKTDGYDAFIWFYYLIQEAGPDVLRAVWASFSQECDCKKWDDRMVEAIGGAETFKKHFRQFALRNLNLSLGEAIKPNYNDGPRTINDFPVGESHVPQFETKRREVLPVAPKGKSLPIMIPRASTNYFHYTPGNVKKLEFNFGGVRPIEVGDLQYVIKLKEAGWRLGSSVKAFSGRTLKLCLDDKKEDFEEIYLIVSNPSLRESASGVWEIKSDDVGCGKGSAAGGIQVHWTLEVPPEDTKHHAQKGTARNAKAQLNLKMKKAEVQNRAGWELWEDDGSTFSLVEDASFWERGPRAGGTYTECTTTHKGQGGGAFDKKSWVKLRVSTRNPEQAAIDGDLRIPTILEKKCRLVGGSAPDMNSAPTKAELELSLRPCRGQVSKPDGAGNRTVTFNCSYPESAQQTMANIASRLPPGMPPEAREAFERAQRMQAEGSQHDKMTIKGSFQLAR